MLGLFFFTPLGGTILGVLFYSMFPEWLILALLVVVLLSTVVFTAQKAYKLWTQGAFVVTNNH